MIELLHLICDYGPRDMAWAEVRSALAACLEPQIKFHMTTVRSFDTISTGFVLAQLALANKDLRPAKMMLFANTAPRKDRREPRVNNEGEGLLYAALKNGVLVVAVNSGFSLSFVKNEIAELWSTNAQEEGSQFRSRDFFPKIVHLATKENFSFLKHKLDVRDTIEDPPPHAVAYVDSFGNLKTSIRSSDPLVASLSSGARLKVRIGSIIRTATVATGMFNVMEGDLAFAPGSSGHDDRYWELFTRGGSAWEEFGHPSTGSSIHCRVND